jgi:hypothetical protein
MSGHFWIFNLFLFSFPLSCMGWGTGDNKKWQSSDFGRESMGK